MDDNTISPASTTKNDSINASYEAVMQNFDRLLANVANIRRERPQLLLAFGVAFLALMTSPPGLYLIRILLRWVGNTLFSIVGVSIGLGLGLGLATHVYEKLEEWDRAGSPRVLPQPNQHTPVAAIQDEQTYASLMASAGYHTIKYAESSGLPLDCLRGQVINVNEHEAAGVRYRFSKQPQPWTAVTAMQKTWPNMPAAVQTSLGIAIEYLVRDYVASWYSMVDPGCQYFDVKKERDEKKQDQRKEGNSKEEQVDAPMRNGRRMLFSLGKHRPLPFLDALYESCSIIFGNLASRVEHVNVFELLLIHWVRILAHTFKWYRTLRKSAAEKHTIVTEMAVAHEFLVTGKLHKAVTFGLDLPSFLFSETEPGADKDKLLEERLFNALPECELDYNRVLAYRMVRSLVSRNDFGSPIIATFLTEVMASCVLNPIMSLFSPDYINSWIIMGLTPSENTDTDETQQEQEGTSETEDRMEDRVIVEKEDTNQQPIVTGDTLTSTLAISLMDLQNCVDFEESRMGVDFDWDDPKCRHAVLRLVLVIECALSHGRCTVGGEQQEPSQEAASEVEVTLPDFEATTLTQTLMELTGDIDSFEAFEEELEPSLDSVDESTVRDYRPTATEQSTLRTLIAAWLHSGEIYRTVSIMARSHVFAKYYRKNSFLRSDDFRGFVRQLRALSGVRIMVDTMAVLSSPRLEETEVLRSLRSETTESKRRDSLPTSLSSTQTFLSSTSTGLPRYLNFNRNAAFSSSLRSERERRMSSWDRIIQEEPVPDEPVEIYRTAGVSEEHKTLHKELHHLARVFYANTNMLALRDAARRTLDEEESNEASNVQVCLLTVETVCPKRRIEVPDDDSSFLLRAQPRPLNAVGVHRDQRNHDQSFKCFAATYETPALPAASGHYTGGKYIRRCLVRYYPIDRTASVALQSDVRKLDQRKTRNPIPETITLGQTTRPFLSSDFLKERHLCQRWVPKGTAKSQSLLASSVMEPTDFTATPRTGKAIDFVYRMNLFERPMLDLGGKVFTVHDSSSLGAHRADASALELSDASLSSALLSFGTESSKNSSEGGSAIEMGKDGYPVLWMKLSRKQDETHVEVKPYRVSFIRAALLLTSARSEAQLRSLVKCVKVGSAKKATKALTDAYLKSTQKLLEYAGSTSRGKESVLLRDLKLGVAHIDIGQLRRNAILSPRHPTMLKSLTATIEDVIHPSEKGTDLFGTSSAFYRIKCRATISLCAADNELSKESGYRLEDGALAETYQEEWVVHRTSKDFQSLHKHLKSQIALSESSGTPGSRLVGAATAAFAVTSSGQGRSKQRNILLPSLSQATKPVALGATKKMVTKRMESLEGYLGYLLADGNLLGQSSELLLFLGATFPLPEHAKIGSVTNDPDDLLGRTEMSRSVLAIREERPKRLDLSSHDRESTVRSFRASSMGSVEELDAQDEDFFDEEEENDQFRKSGKRLSMISSIKSKIDKVRLGNVRKCVFELIRFQFGFENASFARNRLLAALKTLSFAVTTAAEFRKTLYKMHLEYLNAEAVASWIDFLVSCIWPDGIMFDSSDPLTSDELKRQAIEAKELLRQSFPDQLKTILGQELSIDGMDTLHEMMQNRLVVRSMSYMLFDLLWLEVFPEAGDILSGGETLDMDP